jgi:hypothetical protein
LAGRWDGEYNDGESPLSWTNSRDILKKWRDGNWQPVKYGQCWVFSGILNSALRALGIPARSVTNFRSAHDSAPYDGVIEERVKDSGESIWNFHVWNEAWFARPDLSVAEPHWNAVDATPQERSEGRFQTGPASKHDVYNGRRASYDSAFIISEVNAHRYVGTTPYNPRNPAHVRDVDMLDVGRAISTKKPRRCQQWEDCREEITTSYKKDEHKPFSFRSKPQHVFDVSLGAGTPFAGEDLVVLVKRNAAGVWPSATPSTVHATFTATMIDYRGVPLPGNSAVHTMVRRCVVAPKPDSTANTCQFAPADGEGAWKFAVAYEDYAPWLKRTMSMVLELEVKDAHHTNTTHFLWRRQFAFRQPKAELKLPQHVAQGQKFEAAFDFENPLNERLDKVRISVDTPSKTLRFKFPPVPPRVKVSLQFPVQLSKRGNIVLFASVTTEDMFDLSASASVRVEAAPPRQTNP